MKEFEKEFPKPNSKGGMVNDDPLMWWYEKQEGWIAALKWVLESGELLHTHYACGKSTHDIISKELSDD